MTTDEFHAEFYNDVLLAADASGTYAADAFFELFTDYLVEAGELDTADRAYFEGRGMHVDGYAGDPRESQTLTILTVLSDLTPDIGTLTKTQMDTAFKRAQSFVSQSLNPDFRNALDPANPGFGLADLIALSWTKIQKVRLVLLTDRRLSSRVEGKAADEIQGVPVTHTVWDIEGLARLVEEGRGSGVIELDLAEFGGSLPALAAHQPNDEMQTFLLAIPGSISLRYTTDTVHAFSNRTFVFSCKRAGRSTRESAPRL